MQEYKSPVTRVPVEEQKTNSIGVDFSFFCTPNKSLMIDSEPSLSSQQDDQSSDDKPKRGRPKKDSSGTSIMGMISAEDPNNRDSVEYKYRNSYSETTGLLKGAIYEIDTLNNDIRGELSLIRSSKTLKKKYDYFSELASASGSLLGTKIGAIRELNSTITHCHDFEIKRSKEMAALSAGNDDKQIMDLYSAVIGGGFGGGMPSQPTMAQMMTGNQPMMQQQGQISSGFISADPVFESDPGFGRYLSSKSPEQNAMAMERNRDIETVVVYNQQTQQKYFDVINTRTGERVSNMPTPSDIILDDTTINIASGIARNANIDQTYKLIVVGQSESINNY